MLHGEQTGQIRSPCAVEGLWSHSDHRYGGIVHVTGLLQWLDTGSSGKADCDSEGRETPFI